MAARKPVGKSTRFDVFKRDHFTCQYCGGQPPAVVLVIDHIHPVCEGGTNDSDNLLTACEACNQGKAGKQLTPVPNRPDADMLYLETQQEIAELRRYQLAKAERDAINRELITTMTDTWWACLPVGFEWCPADHIILAMLQKYPPEIVETGLSVTAKAVESGHVKRERSGWLRYCWVVMRNIAEEEGNDA